MANSPTDVSGQFLRSGMRLITQPSSDILLTRAKQNRESVEVDTKAVTKDGQR